MTEPRAVGTRALQLSVAAMLAIGGGATGVFAQTPTLVVCAPGHPGTAAQALPTLAKFAERLSSDLAELRGLKAVFCSGPEDGKVLLEDGKAVVALLSLSAYLQFLEGAKAIPVALPVISAGARGEWALVSGRNKIKKAGDLAGWELSSRSGFANDFIQVLFSEFWEPLPSEARLVFNPRSLAALRRAAAGEKVAVLLDADEAAALENLPFFAQLEVVFRTEPLPKSVFVLLTADSRIGRSKLAANLSAVLSRFDRSASGSGILGEMQIEKFEAITAGDRSQIDRLASLVKFRRSNGGR